MTNGDIIRGMSDEELAFVTICPNDIGMADIECARDDSRNCGECILEWLQETEDDAL
jgi:hypothetical protein